jgi:probable HAF family extracellular repeat protein
MNKQRMISILIGLSALLFIVNNVSAVQYEVIDLGPLNGISGMSYAQDINNRGQIVGWSDGWQIGTRAFLWENGNMTDLGTLGGTWSVAKGINDRGQIVGYSETSSGERHAFLYENGTMTDINTITGAIYSEGYGINDLGQIVGEVRYNTGGYESFLYENGKMSAIGGGAAWAINNNGQIVGSLGLYENGSWTSLCDYGCWPHDINEQGQIVGIGGGGPGESHATLYKNNNIIDLGTINGKDSQAHAINESGQIVGQSSYNADDLNDNSQHAFLYQNGVMTDLGTLGGNESIAFGINDVGQIVGTSVNNKGYYSPVLWNPVTVVPEPVSSFLFVIGGATFGFRIYIRMKHNTYKASGCQ